MSFGSRETKVVLEESRWQNVSPNDSGNFTIRERQQTQFYVELEEKCKRRAAKDVSEWATGEKRDNDIKLRNSYEVMDGRVPRYLTEENISRMENYLSEYYMETIYQNLWKKAQNAVFGGEYMR